MPRKEHTYHFIYKTTCTVNNRFYIGMHSTGDLNDGYIGSGEKLRNSVRNYGKENHKMEILEFLPDRKSLAIRESELVNEDLLKNPNCMNLTLGGNGGWSLEQQKRGAKSTNLIIWKNPEFVEKIKKTSSETMKNLWSDPEKSKKLLEGSRRAFKGKNHSEEFKEKMSVIMSEKQNGEKNSQFGSLWIFNTDLKKNKKINFNDLEEYLSLGWSRGRKLKW